MVLRETFFNPLYIEGDGSQRIHEVMHNTCGKPSKLGQAIELMEVVVESWDIHGGTEQRLGKYFTASRFYLVPTTWHRVDEFVLGGAVYLFA